MIRQIHSLAFGLCLIVLSASSMLSAQQPAEPDETELEKLEEPMYRPLVERYILDEIKLLRQEQVQLRADVVRELTATELRISDRALRYTADTTTNIFYIITAAASLLVILGWRSLRDIRTNIESITTEKLSAVAHEYEERLAEIETKLKRRSEQIIATQEKIADTNQVHSLWLRAGLAKSEEEKVTVYDQILELKPDDTEALTYKADTLLEMGEVKWSLSLCNKAIMLDENYSLAYWQRACARAQLGQTDEALDDVEKVIALTETTRDDIVNEKHLANLQDNPRLKAMLDGMA